MSVASKTIARGIIERPRRRRLADAKDVAQTLGMPLTSLYDRTRAKQIPGAIRIGKRIRYDLDVLEAWLDAGGDYSEAQQ